MCAVKNKALDHSQDSVLELFSKGAAYRSQSDAKAVDLFRNAFAADKDLALRCLFYIRDIRGGQGERKVFRTMLSFLAIESPDSVRKNLQSIVGMGRWDDFLTLFGTVLEGDVLLFLRDQWRTDIQALKEGKDSISLLAKWLPSPNASSKETRQRAKVFYAFLDITERQYRQTLSKMRAHLKLIERSMSAKRFDEIDYSKVPSLASLKYRTAFGKKDADRYGAYLAALTKGDKSVKVNAATLFPYDIVKPILEPVIRSESLNALDAGVTANDRMLLDAQWKAQPNYIPKDAGNTLVVADTSGSMFTRDLLPISTSVALAVYFAERNDGLFKNYFITFTTYPSLQEVVGNNIVEKISNVAKAPWQGSTNLQGVFDLILNTALSKGLTEDEMPKRIFIVSDMAFNGACNAGATNFLDTKARYERAGYQMPLLVFWNVNATQATSPVKFDDRGTMLVSGQSPSTFRAVMESKVVTPYDMMLEVLNKDRYSSIFA